LFYLLLLLKIDPIYSLIFIILFVVGAIMMENPD